jgi:Putative amidoligase enzyme
MKKLCEYLGKKNIAGLYGVEIECEGNDLQVAPEEWWKTEYDGSLRGRFPDQAAEYVFKRPMKYGEAVKAIEALNEAQANAKLNFSFRTSCHVHVNVMDCTEDQITNLIYTYYLLENVLLRYCGEVRIGNRFCLRLGDAEEQLTHVVTHIMRGFRSSAHFEGNRVRYAALNLAAIGKYGSIEFRGMRGTMDPNVLLPWIRALGSIKTYACAHNSVVDIQKSFEELGPMGFIKNVLNDDAEAFITKETMRDMAVAYSLAFDIVRKWQMMRDKREQAPQAVERNLEMKRAVKQVLQKPRGFWDVPVFIPDDLPVAANQVNVQF